MRLIDDFEFTNPNTLEDILLIFAKNIENSLIQAGAIAGQDYNILDLYKLAHPFVLEKFKENTSNISYAISW